LLFQFAVSPCPQVLVQFTAGKTGFEMNILKEGHGHFPLANRHTYIQQIFCSLHAEVSLSEVS